MKKRSRRCSTRSWSLLVNILTLSSPRRVPIPCGTLSLMHKLVVSTDVIFGAISRLASFGPLLADRDILSDFMHRLPISTSSGENNTKRTLILLTRAVAYFTKDGNNKTNVIVHVFSVFVYAMCNCLGATLSFKHSEPCFFWRSSKSSFGKTLAIALPTSLPTARRRYLYTQNAAVSPRRISILMGTAAFASFNEKKNNARNDYNFIIFISFST